MNATLSISIFFKSLCHLWFRVQKYFLAILILFLAGGMFLEIALRLMNRSIFSLEDLLLYIVGWLYFLGTAVAIKDKYHQKADILNDVILKNPKSKELGRFISNIISSFLMILLFSSSLEYLKWGVLVGERSMSLGISTKYAVFSMPVGFGLSSLYLLFDAIGHLTRFLSWKKSI